MLVVAHRNIEPRARSARPLYCRLHQHHPSAPLGPSRARAGGRRGAERAPASSKLAAGTLPCARGRTPQHSPRTGALGARGHWHRPTSAHAPMRPGGGAVAPLGPPASPREEPPSVGLEPALAPPRAAGGPGAQTTVSPSCGQFGPSVWRPRAHFLFFPYKFVAAEWFWWHRAPGGGATRDGTILDL